MGFSRQEYWSGVIGSIIIDQVPLGASSVALMVKNLSAMWETWVQSLGWEESLEEGMASHSSVLAWRNPMDRGAWKITILGTQLSN